jgi:hypothetical protein
MKKKLSLSILTLNLINFYSQKKEMKNSKPNFESFSYERNKPIEKWKNYNHASYNSHPDFKSLNSCNNYLLF